MQGTLFLSFIIATLVAMSLIPPLMRLAEKFHAVDIPDERKVHTAPVPRIGGIAIVVGALLPVIMRTPAEPGVAAYLLGALIIVLFGVWDDFKGLDYRVKLTGQLIAVAIVVLYGGLVIRFVPFGGLTEVPDYVAIPFTMFVLIAITNAFNLADGLDGLAAGVALLSLGIIAVIAYLSGGDHVALLALSLSGGILGFLRFNTYPARIFMGDGGSQFLGFSAGVLVIMLTQQTTTALSQAVPLLILGIPMLDTILVTMQRIRERRSPFRPDKNHIHHKFLVLGFDHYEAVFLIYLLHSLLVAGAYLLRFESDALIVLVSAVFSLAIIVFFKLASATGWRAHRHGSHFPVEAKWLRSFSNGQWLLKIAYYFALGAIPLYLVTGAWLSPKVPADIGLLSLLLLAVMLAIQLRGPSRPLNIVERAGIYAVGVFVVYLTQVNPVQWADWSLYRNLLFVALTGCVVIGFRFSEQRFRATPMDYLVIFIALLVPHLPDFRGGHFGAGVAMAIVYCYSTELVLNHTARRWNLIRVIAYAALTMLAMRGLSR